MDGYSAVAPEKILRSVWLRLWGTVNMAWTAFSYDASVKENLTTCNWIICILTLWASHDSVRAFHSRYYLWQLPILLNLEFLLNLKSEFFSPYKYHWFTYILIILPISYIRGDSSSGFGHLGPKTCGDNKLYLIDQIKLLLLFHNIPWVIGRSSRRDIHIILKHKLVKVIKI